jgi:hypothetical protein
MSEVTVANPIADSSTPAISRANRLMSLRSNPGFQDLLQISLQLAKEAADVSIDYPGWDSQQIAVLKSRAQGSKEHHYELLRRIQAAIEAGLAEGRAIKEQLPHMSAEEALETGDFVRQEMLKHFEEEDNRPAGSY